MFGSLTMGSAYSSQPRWRGHTESRMRLDEVDGNVNQFHNWMHMNACVHQVHNNIIHIHALDSTHMSGTVSSLMTCIIYTDSSENDSISIVYNVLFQNLMLPSLGYTVQLIIIKGQYGSPINSMHSTPTVFSSRDDGCITWFHRWFLTFVSLLDSRDV